MLSDVSGLGPFFTVRTGAAEGADPSWRPFAELETDGPALRERVSYVRTALGGEGKVEPRVAASIAFQGIAGVLVSPVYAAAVLHATIPMLGPSELHWRPVAGGPLPMWAAPPRARAVADAGAAAAELAALLDEHLTGMVAAVRAVVPVSPRVLWGNVASVVAGANRMVATGRPDAALRAADIAVRLLDADLLAGTGDRLSPRDPDRYWTFRRRSCCLFYRVPGGGTCGDCILTRATASTAD